MSNRWYTQMSSRALKLSWNDFELCTSSGPSSPMSIHTSPRKRALSWPNFNLKRPHSSTIWILILVKKQDATRMYICRLITDSNTMDHRVNHTRCNIVALRDRGLGIIMLESNVASNDESGDPVCTFPAIILLCHVPLNMKSWIFATVYSSSVIMPCQSEWWVEETLNVTTNVTSRLCFIQKQASSKGFLLPTAPAQRNGHVEHSTAPLYQPWHVLEINVIIQCCNLFIGLDLIII